MKYSADTVVIIGLGLIGGSLARALRASGFSRHFIACGRSAASLERGLALGVIDEYTLDLDEAVARADVLVIATPTLIAEDMLAEILPRLAASQRPTIVTDVASVKGNLARRAQAVCGGEMPPQLVLAHPIAGSERSGVDAADADLFQRHRVILTPAQETDAEALDLVRAMWRSTGAELVDMMVADHDRVLAATSHLPHILAYALVEALASSPASEDIFRFAAGGFRDFTRIASSDPVMWRDIALANKTALLQAIDEYSEQMSSLRAAIETENGEKLLATFARAKQARDNFAAELAERNNPTSQE